MTLSEIGYGFIALLEFAALIVLGFAFVVTNIGNSQMRDEERKLTDRYKAERDAARAHNLPADTLGTGSPVFDGLAVERLHDDLEHWGRS